MVDELTISKSATHLADFSVFNIVLTFICRMSMRPKHMAGTYLGVLISLEVVVEMEW